MNKDIEAVLTDCKLDNLPNTSEVYALKGYRPKEAPVAEKTPSLELGSSIANDINKIVYKWGKTRKFERGEELTEAINIESGVTLTLEASTNDFYKTREGLHANSLRICIDIEGFNSSKRRVSENPHFNNCAIDFLIDFGTGSEKWYPIHRYIDPALRSKGLGKSVFKLIEAAASAYAKTRNKTQKISFTPGGKLTTAAHQVGLILFLLREGFTYASENDRDRLIRFLENDEDLVVGETGLMVDSGVLQGLIFSRRQVHGNLTPHEKKPESVEDVFSTAQTLWGKNIFQYFNNAFGIGLEKTIEF